MTTSREIGRLPRVLTAFAAIALVALGPTFGAAPAYAQVDDVRVVMIASDDAPDVGETFQVQIEARQSGAGTSGNLVPPAFGNLRIVGTTGQMHTQSMHQVFGAVPQIESRTVIGYMLVADQPGVYTISGATYRYGRRTATSEPLVVKVGGSATPVTSTIPGAPAVPVAGGDAFDFDRNAFLRATVDRTDPYVGQQVTYTLYLYTRADGEQSLTQNPSTNDFWSHDLLPPQRPLTPDFQTVRGLDFRVYVVRRVALFPERAGRLEIGSAELQMETGGLIGRMMGRTETVSRTCPPIVVTARALPSNAPTGTVIGTASISADVDRTQVSTGEASTITVTIAAEGSLRDTTVTVPPIDGVRIEPPTIEDRVDSARDLVGGTRTVRIQLVPLRPGTFEIPAISISALDPSTGQLSRPSTQPIRIVATGAAIDDPAIAATDANEPDSSEPNDEAEAFGPVSPRSAMLRRSLPVHARPYFLPLLLAPFALLVAAFVTTGVRGAMARRATSARPTRSSRKPLAEAKKAQSKGDAGDFYAAIAAAIHGQLEQTTGARSLGMTHGEIRTMLVGRGAESELADRIVDELDGADFARFSASGSSKDEMARALERTQALLQRIGKLDLVQAAG